MKDLSVLKRVLPIMVASLLTVSCAQVSEKAPEGPPPSPPAVQNEEGYTPICDKDLSAFDMVHTPATTWSLEEGIVKCTGEPTGYVVTKKTYKNFSLRLNMRFPERPGNSGVLVYIREPNRVWPPCVEVQGMFNQFAAIFPIGGLRGPAGDDNAARQSSIKPFWQWNSLEITSKDGVITSYINGTKVAQAGPFPVKEGPVAFQSEGVPINFHNIRIREEAEN